MLAQDLSPRRRELVNLSLRMDELREEIANLEGEMDRLCAESLRPGAPSTYPLRIGLIADGLAGKRARLGELGRQARVIEADIAARPSGVYPALTIPPPPPSPAARVDPSSLVGARSPTASQLIASPVTASTETDGGDRGVESVKPTSTESAGEEPSREVPPPANPEVVATLAAEIVPSTAVDGSGPSEVPVDVRTTDEPAPPSAVPVAAVVATVATVAASESTGPATSEPVQSQPIAVARSEEPAQPPSSPGPERSPSPRWLPWLAAVALIVAAALVARFLMQ